MECLREAPANLRDYFRKTVRRRVAKDRTVSLDGRIFEAPVPLIGKQVTLLYHEEEPEQVEIVLGSESFGMAVPVNVHVNSRVKRDKEPQRPTGTGRRVGNIPERQPLGKEGSSMSIKYRSFLRHDR